MKTFSFPQVPFYRIWMIFLLAVLFTACDDAKDDKPATYTVTFDTDGGEPAPPVQRIEKGQTATAPSHPTREDYVFKGWFTDDVTFEDEFDFDTPLMGNVILYAKWEKGIPDAKTFTVTFDTGGGTSLPDAFVEEGQTATEPAAPTRQGYAFKGWFTAPDFQNEFDFDTPITENIVLYAKWEEIPPGSFFVRFDTGGGTSLPDVIVEEGQPAAAPSAPTRTYYAFDGWYADEGYTTPFSFSEVITEDRVVYAQWRLDSIGLKVTTYRGKDRLGLAVMEDLFADDELLKLSIEPSAAAQLADFTYTIGNVQKDKVTPVDGSISITQSDLSNLDPPVDGSDIAVTLRSGSLTGNEVTLTYNLYRITHWRDLQAMRQDLTGDYTLENDIVLPDGYNFFPIRGTADPFDVDEDRFRGNFDGSGHRISNLYIDRPSELYVGLFGYVEDQANITNVGIAIAPQGITAKIIVGALIGYKSGGGRVSGYAVGPGAIIGQGKDASTGYGGLIGVWENTTLSTRGELYGYATVDVNTDSPSGEEFGGAGGLVGRATGNVTLVGYATGDVKGEFDVGGLVGSAETFNSAHTAIIKGYATGDVSNFSRLPPRIAGLVGRNTNDPVISGYARGNVTVTDSTGATYGLLTRFDNADAKGYHSGKAGESELKDASGNKLTGNGVDGTEITVDADTQPSDFGDFAFGAASGEWTFIQGKWPAINLPAEVGGAYRPEDQPIDP